MTDGAALLEVRDLTKSFGGIQAVRGVSFAIDTNEVVAMVGDNGAGKSTVVKMISGAHKLDSGEIRWRGAEADLHTPEDARELGIETVYQDLALVGDLDAAGNIFLGDEPYRRLYGLLPVLDRDGMREASKRLLQRVRISLPDIDSPVSRMSGGQRQAVAIARFLRSERAKLIIMDEPTAALGVQEQGKVLDLIDTLGDQGVSVLVISHNLDHVFRVAQRVIVLRGGRCAGIVRTQEVDKAHIVRMIMGGDA